MMIYNGSIYSVNIVLLGQANYVISEISSKKLIKKLYRFTFIKEISFTRKYLDDNFISLFYGFEFI